MVPFIALYIQGYVTVSSVHLMQALALVGVVLQISWYLSPSSALSD